MDFAEYRCLQVNGARVDETREFENAQPSACPQCGVQVFDPFGWNIVIHDVANCHREPIFG